MRIVVTPAVVTVFEDACWAKQKELIEAGVEDVDQVDRAGLQAVFDDLTRLVSPDLLEALEEALGRVGRPVTAPTGQSANP